MIHSIDVRATHTRIHTHTHTDTHTHTHTHAHTHTHTHTHKQCHAGIIRMRAQACGWQLCSHSVQARSSLAVAAIRSPRDVDGSGGVSRCACVCVYAHADVSNGLDQALKHLFVEVLDLLMLPNEEVVSTQVCMGCHAEAERMGLSAWRAVLGAPVVQPDQPS